MSFAYTPAKVALATAALNLSTADIRALLVMTSSTAGTEPSIATLAGFATLDEYDGALYARQALTGMSVTEDDVHARAKFSADPVTFATMGIGTRQAAGMILFKFVTDDSDSLPIAYIDDGGFPFDGNDLDTIMTPDVLGLIQL